MITDKPLTLITLVLASVSTTPLVQAASHMEAPLLGLVPTAQATNVYAFDPSNKLNSNLNSLTLTSPVSDTGPVYSLDINGDQLIDQIELNTQNLGATAWINENNESLVEDTHAADLSDDLATAYQLAVQVSVINTVSPSDDGQSGTEILPALPKQLVMSTTDWRVLAGGDLAFTDASGDGYYYDGFNLMHVPGDGSPMITVRNVRQLLLQLGANGDIIDPYSEQLQPVYFSDAGEDSFGDDEEADGEKKPVAKKKESLLPDWLNVIINGITQGFSPNDVADSTDIVVENSKDIAEKIKHIKDVHKKCGKDVSDSIKKSYTTPCPENSWAHWFWKKLGQCGCSK